MPPNRLRAFMHWSALLLFVAAMLVSGFSKFLPGAGWGARFERWGYAPWFLTTVAVIEVAGAVGLLIPRIRRPAAGLLVVILIGAAATHLSHGEGWQVARPLAYMAVLGLALWLGPRRATAGK